MPSLITPHFPIVRFEDGVRKWFNPVSKVRAVDRPEERVRLRMIEFLVREAGFSANRMSTEPPVPMQASERAGRADILCFDEFHRPLLLVECKAESVKLSEQTAMQAARYNLQIRAPYILLTNGIRDLLFAIQEDGSTRYVPDFASIFPLLEDATGERRISPDLGFTQSRTTAGRKTGAERVTETERSTGTERSTDTAGSRKTFSVRPLAYWQDRGLWANHPPSAVNSSEGDYLNAVESFLTRFWTSRDFGDTTQYIPISHENIKGITGIFARTKVSEAGHLAAGIFSDAEQQLWLMQARTNEKNEPVMRYCNITNTDISLITTCTSILDVINWGS